MKSDNSKHSKKFWLGITCRCGAHRLTSPTISYKKALVENSTLFSSIIDERCPDCGNNMLDVYRKKTAEKPSEKQIHDYLMKKYKDMSTIDLIVHISEEILALKAKPIFDDYITKEMFVLFGFIHTMHDFFKFYDDERIK